jgi:hypothetical protein
MLVNYYDYTEMHCQRNIRIRYELSIKGEVGENPPRDGHILLKV